MEQQTSRKGYEKIKIPPTIQYPMWENTGLRAEIMTPPIQVYDKLVAEIQKKVQYIKINRLTDEIKKDVEQRFQVIEKKDRAVQSSLLQNLDRFLDKCWTDYFEYLSWRDTGFLANNIIQDGNMDKYIAVDIKRQANTIRTMIDGLIQLVGMRATVFQLNEKTYEECVQDVDEMEGDMRLDAMSTLLTMASSIIAGKKEHRTVRMTEPRGQSQFGGVVEPKKEKVEQQIW